MIHIDYAPQDTINKAERKGIVVRKFVYPFSHYTQTGRTETPELKKLEATLYAIDKGEYAYWMEKEIHEQSKMVGNVLQGRVNLKDKSVVLEGIREYEERLARAPALYVMAHGTSFNAASE